MMQGSAAVGPSGSVPVDHVVAADLLGVLKQTLESGVRLAQQKDLSTDPLSQHIICNLLHTVVHLALFQSPTPPGNQDTGKSQVESQQSSQFEADFGHGKWDPFQVVKGHSISTQSAASPPSSRPQSAGRTTQKQNPPQNCTPGEFETSRSRSPSPQGSSSASPAQTQGRVIRVSDRVAGGFHYPDKNRPDETKERWPAPSPSKVATPRKVVAPKLANCNQLASEVASSQANRIGSQPVQLQPRTPSKVKGKAAFSPRTRDKQAPVAPKCGAAHRVPKTRESPKQPEKNGNQRKEEVRAEVHERMATTSSSDGNQTSRSPDQEEPDIVPDGTRAHEANMQAPASNTLSCDSDPITVEIMRDGLPPEFAQDLAKDMAQEDNIEVIVDDTASFLTTKPPEAQNDTGSTITAAGSSDTVVQRSLLPADFVSNEMPKMPAPEERKPEEETKAAEVKSNEELKALATYCKARLEKSHETGALKKLLDDLKEENVPCQATDETMPPMDFSPNGTISSFVRQASGSVVVEDGDSSDVVVIDVNVDDFSGNVSVEESQRSTKQFGDSRDGTAQQPSTAIGNMLPPPENATLEKTQVPKSVNQEPLPAWCAAKCFSKSLHEQQGEESVAQKWILHLRSDGTFAYEYHSGFYDRHSGDFHSKDEFADGNWTYQKSSAESILLQGEMRHLKKEELQNDNESSRPQRFAFTKELTRQELSSWQVNDLST